jgi:hypothetical protein
VAKRYLDATAVRRRYNRSLMSISRWLANEALGFPKPIYIYKRRFWDADELDAFDRARGAKIDELNEAAA